MAADRTNVVIKATDVTGKQVSTTINYANPNASNSTLKTMGQMMNALTTNSYMQTNRTDITFLDTAPAEKQTPTLTIAKTTFSKGASGGPSGVPTADGQTDSSGNWNITETFSYNGDGVPFITSTASNNDVATIANTNTNTYQLTIKLASGTTLPTTLQIGATEGTNYKAVAPITITFNS